MTIKKLRKTFKKALVYYQKAIDEQWDKDTLAYNNMNRGLCRFCIETLNVDIYDSFDTHYSQYFGSGWICEISCVIKTRSTSKIHNKCIQPRLDFLKNEIIRLKKLENKGYTHIYFE